MKKYFNITGLCYPEKHYMVDLTERLKQIRKMIEKGEYFIINRGRQYGKTTTLWALKQYLNQEYATIFLSFQRMSDAKFQNEYTFSAAFAKQFLSTVKNQRMNITGLNTDTLENLEKALTEDSDFDLSTLFEHLSQICETADKPVVLMIDEIDSASNNEVFINFLGILRDYYLFREINPIFQSVILAGVYDIKNLKRKIRPDEVHQYNSPWNIAAEFNVEMNFSEKNIQGMLQDYEQDCRTGMDISQIAELIYEYTSGYPFLVSRICKILDEGFINKKPDVNKDNVWTREGIQEAVSQILREKNTLFDDMVKKLSDYPELHQMLNNILFNGKKIPYNVDNTAMDIGTMFGFIKEIDGLVAVVNRIFEMRIYNLFLSEEVLCSESYKEAERDRNQFITDGMLNIELVLQKFLIHFTDVYGDCEDRFVEENGRRFFLLYLKPIINGTGNYYIEARTRNMKRTDVIVDYRGQQFIIEMKIWRGNEYNCRGEQQLREYLEYYHLDKGYMLSFCFNKNKKVGMHEVICDGKRIIEAVV